MTVRITYRLELTMSSIDCCLTSGIISSIYFGMLTPAEKTAKSLHKKKKLTLSGRKVVWACSILAKRRGLSLTLRDIERHTGVSSAVLSTIEHGTDPQLTTARRIAEFFGCAVEELWPNRLEK